MNTIMYMQSDELLWLLASTIYFQFGEALCFRAIAAVSAAPFPLPSLHRVSLT